MVNPCWPRVEFCVSCVCVCANVREDAERMCESERVCRRGDRTFQEH